MRCVKRLVKRVCWLLGLLIALMFISVMWGLTPYPKPPKGVRLAPLRSPLPLAELRPDNAAYFYIKACDLLAGYKQSDESKTQMEALVESDLGIHTPDIEATIADCRETLELVHRGTAVESCQMPWVDPNEQPDPFAQRLRQLGRLLECEGKLAERAGNTDQAFETYITVTKLGCDCTHGGPILSMLLGNAITARATRAIRCAIRRQELHAGVVEKAQSKLEQLRTGGQTYDETLRYELVYSKQMCEQTFAQSKGLWITRAARSYGHLADAAFGDLIEDANEPFVKRHGDAIIHKWSLEGRPLWTWMWNRPVPRILLDMLLPVVEPLGRRVARADMDLQATIAACALRRSELTHGKPPEQLTDLVPDFLPLVPIDPFDGKPLRYRREGTEWVIWSVGSDLKDDNAAWHEFKYRKQHGENREGGDIYFKSTEPQDDLADYLKRKDSKHGS